MAEIVCEVMIDCRDTGERALCGRCAREYRLTAKGDPEPTIAALCTKHAGTMASQGFRVERADFWSTLQSAARPRQ